MRETKVSPYLKNLQRNALFYLQMAALLLLVFILLDPFLPKNKRLGDIRFYRGYVCKYARKQGETTLFTRNQEVMKELAENVQVSQSPL